MIFYEGHLYNASCCYSSPRGTLKPSLNCGGLFGALIHNPFQIAGDISTGNASAINFDSYLSVARLHLRGQKREFLFCWIT